MDLKPNKRPHTQLSSQLIQIIVCRKIKLVSCFSFMNGKRRDVKPFNKFNYIFAVIIQDFFIRKKKNSSLIGIYI